jgi:hypothetical protein
MRACRTHRRDEKCVQNFGRKKLKGRDHSEDLGVDGRIILEWILGKYGGKVWTGFI